MMNSIQNKINVIAWLETTIANLASRMNEKTEEELKSPPECACMSHRLWTKIGITQTFFNGQIIGGLFCYFHSTCLIRLLNKGAIQCNAVFFFAGWFSIILIAAKNHNNFCCCCPFWVNVWVYVFKFRFVRFICFIWEVSVFLSIKESQCVHCDHRIYRFICKTETVLLELFKPTTAPKSNALRTNHGEIYLAKRKRQTVQHDLNRRSYTQKPHVFQPNRIFRILLPCSTHFNRSEIYFLPFITLVYNFGHTQHQQTTNRAYYKP